MQFDKIDAKEMRATTWMFTQTNWFDYYDCYQSYVCKKCKKFDWLAATQNGIHATPKLPVKMPDFIQTSDRRSFVASGNVKKVFETFSKKIATFLPIPKTKDYYVLLPNQLLMPPAKIPVVGDWKEKNGPWRSPEAPRCKQCKKFPDLCFHREWYIVPDDIVFAGIVIDVKSMSLVASRELSEHLRQAKLIGLTITKNAFANPKK